MYFLKYAASINAGYLYIAKSQPYGSRLVPSMKNILSGYLKLIFCVRILIIMPPLLNLVAATR